MSRVRRFGWGAVVTDMDWHHRLTLTVPMAFLGIIDSTVSLLTLGFVQPGLALDWGFRASLFESRRYNKNLPEEPTS